MKNIFFPANSTTMKSRHVLVLFVLAALTLSLLPTPQATAMQRRRMRAISGTYDTTFGAPTPLDPSTLLAVIKHHGSARPLGNFTGTIVQTIDFSDSSLQTLSTFITADGDVLRAIATGSFGQSSADVVTFEGFYEFTGGTGKFRDAKGTAYFTGSANLAMGLGHVEFRGMISY